MKIKNAMPTPITLEIKSVGKIHLGAANYDDRLFFKEIPINSNLIFCKVGNRSGYVKFSDTTINFSYIPDPEPDTIFIAPAKVIPALRKLGRRDFWCVDKNGKFAEGLKQ